MNAQNAVHRLLFYALLDIRDEARRIGNSPIYHLADLFHNVALKLDNAASGDPAASYDDLLTFIVEHARSKGWEKWVDDHIEHISSRSAAAIATD